jgi:hypothetical protein
LIWINPFGSGRGLVAISSLTSSFSNSAFVRLAPRSGPVGVGSVELAGTATQMMRKWREEDRRKIEYDRQHDLAVEQIGAMLAGRPPQAQGAILADLLSMWLAGWQPTVREESLSLLLKLAHERVPVQEERVKQLP